VLHLSEVRFPESKHRSAEEFRVPADEIILARAISAIRAVQPGFACPVTKLTEYGLGIPILQFPWQIVPAFDNQDARIRPSQLPCNGASSYTRTDDDNVGVHGSLPICD
jgi:hypothetical protein